MARLVQSAIRCRCRPSWAPRSECHCFERPDAGIPNVRIRGGPGKATTRGYPTAEDRPPGDTGVSAMLDPVTLSWRDLAMWMIALRDEGSDHGESAVKEPA